MCLLGLRTENWQGVTEEMWVTRKKLHYLYMRTCYSHPDLIFFLTFFYFPPFFFYFYLLPFVYIKLGRNASSSPLFVEEYWHLTGSSVIILERHRQKCEQQLFNLEDRMETLNSKRCILVFFKVGLAIIRILKN